MELQQATIEILDIEKLHRLPFNREVKMNHVTSLLNSMNEFGILRLPVIIRTNVFGKLKDYIIDAQHMVSALIKADQKTIQCIVVEENDIHKIIKTMAVLNNTASIWKLDDYVNAFAHMPGKEAYKFLKIHHLSTGFNYSVSAKILSGTETNIKKGTFKINCSDADDITSKVIEISSIFNINNSKFQKAVVQFLRSTKELNYKKFLQTLAKNKQTFPICHDETLMMNTLSTFIN
jgi:hypothetical protein